MSQTENEVVREIPGSEYFTTDEASAVLVLQPDAGFYQTHVFGTPSEEFTLSNAVVDLLGPDAEAPTIDEDVFEDELGPDGSAGPYFFGAPSRCSNRSREATAWPSCARDASRSSPAPDGASAGSTR